ncbi:MAG: hypothetical protein CSA36_06815 [Draconibacterium sp.]|nr:MAG: hypothetical protein CSA36_06815 [Draconibacterium sp.]
MTHKILIIIAFILVVVSCDQNRGGNDMFYADDIMEEVKMMPGVGQYTKANPSPEKPLKPEADKKKIIRDGRIGLRVTELEKAKARIDSLVKKYNAYYAGENFNNYSRESVYLLKVRIPAQAFDQFVNDTENGKVEVLYKELSSRDVTEEYIDLETRLKNKRAYLNRFKELLKQARTISEILEIEEKIRGLEEEIESTTGRLRYLSNQVDYSSLDISLSKLKDFKYKPDIRDKFSEQLKKSLSKGWYGFIDIMLFLIRLWPLWIVSLLLIYLIKTIKKRRKQL